MNRIFRLSLHLLFLSALTTPAMSQSVRNNDVISAVLNVYDEELQVDPANYNVLFRRAHLFYGQNQYNRALTDIDRAITVAPRNDTDFLVQCFSLRANIYLMTDNPAKALPDLTEACRLDQTSYTLLYQKANTEYLLGDYAAAKEDYKALQRRHNRSLESLVGLARVAVKENNLGLANEYVDEAVALYPSDAEAYIRRASVRRLLGNMTGAVDDLILAVAVDKNNTHALQEIVAISHVDYNAVITALTSAIQQAPDVGIYTYLRASIAQAHYHYLPALADYQSLIDRNIYNYHGIYASMAECYMQLAMFDKALDNINNAIGSTADNAPYYIIRSRIRRAMGDNLVAMESAMMAFEKSPDLNSALIEKGYCAIALDRYRDASDYLGEASLNAPADPLLPLVRGWLLSTRLKQQADGYRFLQLSAEVTDYPASIISYKGFALQALGLDDAARGWLTEALKADDVDGRVHYLAACLYSRLGDLDTAFEMMAIALDKGYASLYDWRYNDLANINVSMLRSDERFDQLLNRYNFLFKQ